MASANALARAVSLIEIRSVRWALLLDTFASALCAVERPAVVTYLFDAFTLASVFVQFGAI